MGRKEETYKFYKCRKCGERSLRFNSTTRTYKCLRFSCGYECSREEFFYPGKFPDVTETRPVAPAAPVLLNNRYIIQRQLKVGGMAVVSLAEDTRTGSPCVIKVPRSDTQHDARFNVDKLVLEAAYLRQFNHPNIVKFVDIFTHDDIFHLVVEYVEGEDLLTAFASRTADERQAVKWGGQILDALEYVHRFGLVHRDVNPGNIMLRRRDDSVALIDFGTVKPVAGDSWTVVRKPGFDVPEQVAVGHADARSDLFGVGGVLFYLLTSTPPGLAGSQDIAALLTRRGVSERVARCIAQALRIKPEERFQSAIAMREALTGGAV